MVVRVLGSEGGKFRCFLPFSGLSHKTTPFMNHRGPFYSYGDFYSDRVVRETTVLSKQKGKHIYIYTHTCAHVHTHTHTHRHAHTLLKPVIC